MLKVQGLAKLDSLYQSCLRLVLKNLIDQSCFQELNMSIYSSQFYCFYFYFDFELKYFSEYLSI